MLNSGRKLLNLVACFLPAAFPTAHSSGVLVVPWAGWPAGGLRQSAEYLMGVLSTIAADQGQLA